MAAQPPICLEASPGDPGGIDSGSAEGEGLDAVAGKRDCRRAFGSSSRRQIHLDRPRPDGEVEAFGAAVRKDHQLERPTTE